MKNALSILSLSALLGCGGAQAAPEVATSSAEASPFGSIDAALSGAHRSEEDRARDGHRHPRETLEFFGVGPSSRVLELWPGRGWYTAILAPLVHDDGQLRVVAADNRYLQGFRDTLAAQPSIFDRVELVVIQPADGSELSFGPDGSADVVLTFRNYHGWMNEQYEDEVLAAAFRVLRPGGVLGVVEHRAAAPTDRETVQRTGYVAEQTIIEAAQAAGFVLDERSEINANPADTRDHPNGVWSLPPTLRGGDEDRERFVAIGESDRMTLRFRRPE
ncbi:MAG: methyltransferase domain-containing protein [Sandaracinaceae bacterium]|nr:methyltransferase domain-containing protein [Sandaracinaceae bacterium]